MIPIRDDNPTRRFPFATLMLVAANVAVFVYMLTLPDSMLIRFLTDWAITPAHLIATPTSPRVLATLVTAMFIHGGWLHLGGNMLYLWIFGNNVEDALGPLKFTAFYLACGIIATLVHVFIQGPSEVPLLGASGAIAGVLAAYLLLFPKAHVLVLIPIFFIVELARVPAAFVIGFWFVMQLIQGVGSVVPGAVGDGVAWWAHVGGFVAGLILILPSRLMGGRRQRRGPSSFTTWR
ncbi:MAG: rhomboid family intramembrane serine protease [Coriobacteriia bacterium]|nr:rhomboid family intramembrane serine protease [Coriobacteriia bacterium]